MVIDTLGSDFEIVRDLFQVRGYCSHTGNCAIVGHSYFPDIDHFGSSLTNYGVQIAFSDLTDKLPYCPISVHKTSQTQGRVEEGCYSTSSRSGLGTDLTITVPFDKANLTITDHHIAIQN